MVLSAKDELRHDWNDDYYWRESLYFNFADPVNEIGAWLYLWVLPNQEQKSGMLVSFYHGITARFDATDLAMAAPGHLWTGDAGNWVYCFKQDFDGPITADFDNVELGGLTLKRIDPLKRYAIHFADDADNTVDLQCDFLTIPYDYADGLHATPPWVAANRYHRGWRATGEVRIGGRTLSIATTGDSDHSWGQRHPGKFAENLFKMWSFQRPDGSLVVSAIEQGPHDGETVLGFAQIDGDLESADVIEERARYTADGLQQNIAVQVTDGAGRSIRASMDQMFAAIGFGRPAHGTWGFEGVGLYQVDGQGDSTGIASYFWPPVISPEELHTKDPA